AASATTSTTPLLDAFDPYLIHGDRGARAVAGVARQLGNFVGDFLAFDHFAEDGVLVVEPGCGRDGDEKLAAVGAGSGIGHRELAGFGVLERRVEFVAEGV